MKSHRSVGSPRVAQQILTEAEAATSGRISYEIRIVSEIMAELLVSELLQNEGIPKDRRVSQLLACAVSAGLIQTRVSGLISKISRSLGDKDFKELAWRGLGSFRRTVMRT